MKTGTSSIVLGLVVTIVFGLGTLRNLVVLPLALAATGPTAYLIGSFIGAALAAVVLALGIRQLRRGLAQRQAWHRVQAGPAPVFPTR